MSKSQEPQTEDSLDAEAMVVGRMAVHALRAFIEGRASLMVGDIKIRLVIDGKQSKG